MTATITICTKIGAYSVDATVIGGLAYHHTLYKDGTPTDRWNVTHIASGLSMLPRKSHLNSPEACIRYIELIKDLADWTRSSALLLDQYGPKAGEIRETIISAFRKAQEAGEQHV